MNTIADVLSGAAEWALLPVDCLGPDGLPSLPDRSVAHVITDPPFASDIYERGGINNHQTTITGKSPGMIVMKAGGIGELVLQGATEACSRLAQRWSLMFCDVESVADVRRSMLAAGLRYVRTGAWTKVDPMPQFTGDRPAQGFEACCIAHVPLTRGKMRWNGGGRAAVWHHAICKQDRPDHPCPKPIPLMEELVTLFTDPGDIILDPFAGSGTTGVACIRLGRRFIGMERDPKHAATAVKRLSAARRQEGLFDRVPVSKPKQLKLGGAA